MNKGSNISMLIIFISALLSVSILPIINKKKKPGETNYLSFWNPAEKIFLEKGGRKAIYSGEYMPVIETGNVCEMGKLTALSFIHWIKDNPNGVVALPTGKTPELFIEYLKYYKEHWNQPEVQRDLRHHGVALDRFPETSGLKFVQLDEFFPIDTTFKNSFTSYINRYYLDLLQIPRNNVLQMDVCSKGILKDIGHEKLFPSGRVDLSLATREPVNDQERLQKQALQEVEAFCDQYEQRIRDMGGIGFFLGGIGPEGHVAFNMQGAPLDSRTRLVKLNYPSAAAAAGDLGGIEYSRDRSAVTIGLGTIAFNPDATVIIIAAGEAKAPVVADALQHPKNSLYPATAFQNMKGARFYLTKGAASRLNSRRLEDMQKKRFDDLKDEEIDEVVLELALVEKKRIVDLTKADFLRHPKSALLIRKFRQNLRDLLNDVRTRLTAKIEAGLSLPGKTTVLHTGPHHDDVMLSYHPLMKKMLPENRNYFAYLTSGFNSVTDAYLLHTLNRIPVSNLPSYSPEIFNYDYAFILRRYINAADSRDKENMERTESIILLKNLCRLYGIDSVDSLAAKLHWLSEEYFPQRLPGEKDIRDIQLLKGAMRESEADRMLLMAGVPLRRVSHMRAGFYNGDYFNPMPSVDRDAKPLLKLCEKVRPGIVTVALDPEGTGPDTHYKVLQVVAQVVKMHQFPPGFKVWGYRNVWHRFSLSEATLMAPVSNEDIKQMNHTFLTCFSTQRDASFPAADYDGPFSELAEKIQREQFEQLKILLGDAYFARHSSPEIRKAAGFVFIKEMGQEEFSRSAQDLKNRIEML